MVKCMPDVQGGIELPRYSIQAILKNIGGQAKYLNTHRVKLANVEETSVVHTRIEVFPKVTEQHVIGG